MKTLMISAVAAAALAATAWAQAPDPHDHSTDGGKAPSVAQPGMGGMNMMRMMQTMHGNMMGMGMTERVEGRIAFLRAELKITDAQTSAWNAFADALRANAQKLTAARPAMTPSARGQQTLTERLDGQERWLTARLEGIRSIKAAFIPLFGAFSEEQKKAATELLGPHLGLAMTPGPMMSGMVPGLMGSGRMSPR